MRLPQWVVDALPAALRDELASFESLLRPAEQVLCPRAMHTATSTQLSFANTLIDKMTSERWSITAQTIEVAADGTGFLSFNIDANGHIMSFGVRANQPLPNSEARLFRDTEVECFGVLANGPFDRRSWEQDDQEFVRDLWRGRAGEQVLGWTIASRGHAFESTIQALAAGGQPSRERILSSNGYLLRNGGFYGNGRIGTRAWASYAHAGWPFESPYHVDLFTLYLWRVVSYAICEAAARARSGQAARLDPAIKRYFGVGNASGLGTVAALVRWPERLSSFVLPREIALAYVMSRPAPIPAYAVERVTRQLKRIAQAYDHALDPGDGLVEPRVRVATALRQIAVDAERLGGDADCFGERPWLGLADAAARHDSREAIDQLRSCVIDAYSEVRPLRSLPAVSASYVRDVHPEMTVDELRGIIETRYRWLLEIDFGSETARHFFWYRSEENGENRRGERSVDLGVERETFVDTAGAVRRLYDFLLSLPADQTVGEFLLCEPDHTAAVRRVQIAGESPYSELQADVCDQNFRASDGIRTFLAILGIDMAVPATTRWVRGVFFQGAPLPDDLIRGGAGEWRFPTYDGTDLDTVVCDGA